LISSAREHNDFLANRAILEAEIEVQSLDPAIPCEAIGGRPEKEI
jgi:hypothetical protein